MRDNEKFVNVALAIANMNIVARSDRACFQIEESPANMNKPARFESDNQLYDQ